MDSHELTLEAEGLKLPDISQLGTFARETDAVVVKVKDVLDYVTKWGSLIPGAGAVVGPLQFLDKALGIVDTFLKHVPGE